MTVKQRIEGKVRVLFDPQHLEVINESSNHSVPPGSETHFKVLIVSRSFAGRSLIERHRMVFAALDAEMKGGVHALSLQVHTPEEWVAKPQKGNSPPCLGGSKADEKG